MRMNTKLSIPLSLLSIWSAACAETPRNAEYDFFERAQYPGNRLRPEVELTKIEQEGGPGATGYNRRTVTFWPRQGIDIIPEAPQW